MTQELQAESVQLLELLKWYQGTGVDLAVNDAPVDQFALSKTKVPPKNADRPATKTSAVNSAVSRSAQTPIDSSPGDPSVAKNSAESANNLDELRSALENLEGCALKIRATQLVFSGGNRDANIMLIGKAPSREDDLQGQIFSGPAGQLLDNMFKAIGLDREHVYLANIVPWRPPGNRDPSPNEIEMCLPFLIRQVELAAPTLIVTFGELATRCLLGDEARVNNSRGLWHSVTVGAHKTKILTSLHPEFLIKQPAQKQQSWSDLLLLKKAIAEQCPIS